MTEPAKKAYRQRKKTTAVSSLTEETAVDTLRIHDGNGIETDTSRARVESTKTGRRGGGGPELDRTPGAGRDRNSGITGATDPDNCQGGAKSCWS
jgi:hypothetical protein